MVFGITELPHGFSLMGSIVPEASYKEIASSACPGRLLLVEQQVSTYLAVFGIY
jgi:hypothetical protein